MENKSWQLKDVSVDMSKKVEDIDSIYDFAIKNLTTDVSGKVSLRIENFKSTIQLFEENDILEKAISDSDKTLKDFWNKYSKISDDAEIRKMTQMLLLIACCLNQKENDEVDKHKN